MSSMASASFYKKQERNPSKSNRDIPTSDTVFLYIWCLHVHMHTRTAEMVRRGMEAGGGTETKAKI